MGRKSTVKIKKPDTPSSPTGKASHATRGSGCGHCHTQKHCAIGGIYESGFRELDILISEKSFAKGEALFSPESPVGIYRVLKVGSAHLVSSPGTHAPIALALLGKGTVLSGNDAPRCPPGVSIKATSKSRVCEIPLTDLRSQLDSAQWDTIMDAPNACTMLLRWSEIIRLSSIQARMVATLVLLSEIQHSTRITIQSQAELARLINSTRESVARSLSQLIKLGLIQRIDPHLYEVNVSALTEWARALQAPQVAATTGEQPALEN